MKKALAKQKHEACGHATPLKGCKVCIHAKGKRKSYKRKSKKRKDTAWLRFLQCGYTDLAGPLPVSVGKYRYWQIYVDARPY